MLAMAGPPPYQGPTSMDYSVDDLAESLSRMLVRGDRYGMDNAVESIELEETWAWPDDDDARYLDASCLVFDSQRQLLATVDFTDKACPGSCGERAVEHSGDKIECALSEGRHSISVDLKLLSANVNEIFVTLSAWGECRLGDILQPRVSMVERRTGKPLCHYELEKVSTEDLQRYTSVIMCRVYRTRPGADTWEVEALGQLGMGNASDYSPMIAFIQSGGLALADMMSSFRM